MGELNLVYRLEQNKKLLQEKLPLIRKYKNKIAVQQRKIKKVSRNTKQVVKLMIYRIARHIEIYCRRGVVELGGPDPW